MFEDTLTTNSNDLLNLSANSSGTTVQGSAELTSIDLITPGAFLKTHADVGSSRDFIDDVEAAALAIDSSLTLLDISVISYQTPEGLTAIDDSLTGQQPTTTDTDPLLGQSHSVGVASNFTADSAALAQGVALSNQNLLNTTTLAAATTATDPNGTISTALDAGDLISSITKTGSIGYNESYGRDTRDYWQFSVTEAGKVNLSLTGLSQNAGLALYNSSGKLLTWSNNGGNSSESLGRWLGTGDYYALVYSEGSWGGQTSYSLNINAGTSLDGLLDDYSVTNSVSSRLSDGYIDRNDMISILRSTKDYGSVNSYELNDLRDILNDAKAFGIEGYVENLADKVVNGNAANAKYQGATLGNLYSGATDSHMEKLVLEHFYGKDRPTIGSSYSYKDTSGSLFQNGISYTDVDQGAVGDCYYLASLGAAAHQKSNFIKDMFIDNGDNTFTVRFFKNGQEDYVTVDRYLPFNSAGYFVYANNSSGKKYNDTSNELWVAFAEKAYAQLNEAKWIGQDGTNSYEGIAFGQPKKSMNHITGLNTDSDSILNKFIITIGDNISDIISAYNSDKMVTLSTKDSGVDSGIVANHAYTMVGYSSTTKRFKLYNPWGGSGSTIYLSHQQVKDNFHNWDYTTT